MQHAHKQSNANIVYNYLRYNNSSSTVAQLQHATQLTLQQVNSALQNLQQRKLVVSSKQAQQRTHYSAVVAHNVSFRAARSAVVAVAQHAQSAAQQQQTVTQRAVQLLNAMLAKLKH